MRRLGSKAHTVFGKELVVHDSILREARVHIVNECLTYTLCGLQSELKPAGLVAAGIPPQAVVADDISPS
jgi:hypothetical protein